MEYQFRSLEKKWQQYWREKNIYKVTEDKSKPKYYVLDMFPYPSGAGLHVGHPLGYIATDIFSRYKRLKGFNVLHPMGYDAFGLPAEQYAIQTGQHPAITTEKNIARYREQLDSMGFCFDWSREVKTSDPKFYKWTQWIFLKLFNSWYNKETDKAEAIETLIEKFKVSSFKFQIEGKEKVWDELNEREKSDVLMNYRLAFQKNADVWWCPELGTVLANDEVQDGVSVRGGYPVFRKSLKQWFLRITSYAQRLLNELENLDWSSSMKEVQTNWIGRSEGAVIQFSIFNFQFSISVFTTRPDTIFGATFLVLAPENKMVEKITAAEQKTEVEKYLQYVKTRSERERQSEVKKLTGVFTGAFAIHPFTNEKLPIWISEYVLAGYGTGAIMAVPAHDERDFAFAKYFKLPINQVIVEIENFQPLSSGTQNFEPLKGAYEAKEGKCINSDFLNGLEVKDAIKKAIDEIEKRKIGERKINFKLRDAAFSRQRYWGEPFPIYYRDGIPYPVDEKDLPLELPPIDSYKPTPDGEAPLARAKNWTYAPPPSPLEKDQGIKVYPLETDTMPGYAGSSWYFFRYMDSLNENNFCSKELQQYWQNVDLYVGGAEHATGHLLYARFWTHFLFDLGLVIVKEPFKKLVNQGMIQGMSQMVLKRKGETNIVMIPYSNQRPGTLYFGNETRIFFYSVDFRDEPIEESIKKHPYEFTKSNVPIELVDPDGTLKISEFTDLFPEHKKAVFICKYGYWMENRFIKYSPIYDHLENPPQNFYTEPQPEKMSKSKFNVINPDDVIEKYGADTFRLYEMFLGPIEQSKPWDTNGIEGVHRFLKKVWNLCLTPNPSPKERGDAQKILHKTIKKVEEDIERLSFNTAISAMMICVNELTELKCTDKNILSDFIKILSPFAPHIAEELWEKLGNKNSVVLTEFPKWNPDFIKENTFNYPIAINGKTRGNVEFDLTMTKETLEKEILETDLVKKYLDGKQPKKVIVVTGRMINIVV